MSNDNMWEDEEPFSDKPEAAQTGPNGLPVSPTPVDMPHQYAPPTIPKKSNFQTTNFVAAEAPEEDQDIEENEEDDYSEVLTDANLRLEQGSLYKLIMKHSLFEGVDADPKAVQNVQKAIRKFAREQMEVMLGMRKDTATVENLQIDFPFNQVEVEVLKMLANKASGGASENSDNYVPTVTRTTQEVPVIPRRNTLNPIGHGYSGKKPTSKPLSKNPSPSRGTAPARRTQLDDVIDRVVQETGVSRELLEENQLLSKPVRELSSAELEERNRLVAKRRGTQVRSSQALPMPSAEQQASMVETHVPKVNKLVELAMKMPPSKLLNSGQ
jgi:hypothetical protein